VQEAAGKFDVSHMQVVDIRGCEARSFLRRLLAKDVARLTLLEKELYSYMLNEEGDMVDDLIVYYLDDAYFRRNSLSVRLQSKY
jgi:aminomethyltransferase